MPKDNNFLSMQYATCLYFLFTAALSSCSLALLVHALSRLCIPSLPWFPRFPTTQMQDELRNAHLLVYANKQDAQNAHKPTEVAEKLGLSEIRNRPWYIQASSAVNGEGLYEGMDWLSRSLRQVERR